MTLDTANQLPAIRILNRFYAVFTVFCLLLLVVGVPFVFVRKWGAALSLLAALACVFVAWQVSRQGHPRKSLIIFSTIIWVLMVVLMFVGLSTNGASVALAFALMLSIVVSQRAGLLFAVSYLLAWLVYIVLGFYQLAPTPYFANVPLTGWIIVAGACWLFLIPVPELVKSMNQGAAMQRSVFDATSDALLVVDRSGVIESLNQRFVAMWRLPDRMATGRDKAAMLEFVLTQVDDPAAFKQRVSEIYAQPQETSFDTLYFKDGRVIERYSQPNFMGMQTVGRVWSFRDVTDSHRSQKELRSSQAKFQGLFDLSPLGMTRNDMDGNFHEVNAAFRRMLGYDLDELHALSYWDITPQRFAEQEKAQLESLRTLGTYGPYEKEYIHKSGNTFPVRLNGMLIRGPDGQPFIWSIIEDISEQKAHERTLTEARKSAEDASNAKGEFLANMSHEIRTPMNAILGMLKLLGNTPLNANQFDYLSKTEGAAKSLLGLLNDILDLSKIDSGKMELDLHPFSVEQLLRNLAVVLSANVGNKSIEVLFDIDPAIPAQLVGDSLRLQQALINLGGNAIKFTSSGQVVVGLKLVPSDAQESGVLQIAFSVEDSGIGIAPANQARIFSDFSQAESSTTRRFGGTGLGLAISKRLVELMGGHITLHSELGAGSTFSFVLGMPVGHPAPVGDAALRTQGLAAHPSVLVVDDNARSGAIMTRMLGGLGWRAELARSGQEALDRMHSHIANNARPYDCIYVDWQMPRMDGWEFLRQLNSLRPTLAGPFPRIIMLSANGRESLAQRTDEEQGLLNGFLVKPVTLSMVLDASRDQPADGETLRKSPRSSKRQLSGMRILVVEDNAINQQVAEELLGFEGALVSIAADGRQGVNAVASAKVQFDAVLMDIQMPVMDGYAATRVIRDKLGLTSLPIVGLTANAMASDREACLRAGMNEHVGKPFDMAQLVSLLIKLTGHQPVSPSPRPASMLEAGPDAAVNTQQPGPAWTTADIDLPVALNRMGGMRALYVQSARVLQTMLATLPADLDERLQQADWHEADIFLHSLKGNAATLGLNRLAGALRELEALCKARGSLEQMQALAAALPPVLQSAQDGLRNAITLLDEPERSSATGTLASGDVSVAKAVVGSQLIPLLMASDLAVLDAFNQARHALMALPPDQMEQLEAAMQALDLPTALTICQKITAT